MYTLILEKGGYKTSVVSVVDQLEGVIESFSPEIIVMDNQLKHKQSGFEASILLRANGINLPIIFTTGNSENLAKEFVLKVSNSTYKIKPIDGYELLEAINSILK